MKLKFIITISETRLSADSPFSVEQGSSPYKSRPVKECRCPDRSPTAGFGKTFFKRRAEKAVGLGYIASENQDISLEAGQHRRNVLWRKILPHGICRRLPSRPEHVFRKAPDNGGISSA